MSRRTRHSKPLPREPIHTVETRPGRVRFRVVVDARPAGVQPRRQVTRTFWTLDQARDFLAEVRHETDQGNEWQPAVVVAPPAPETVRELAHRWLTRDDVRVVTVRGYSHALVPVLRRLGARTVDSLTVRDARELTAWLGREGGRHGGPLSPRSVRASLGALAQALDVALAEGSIPTNVVRSPAVRPPRSERHEVAHWTPAELRAFVQAGDATDWAAVWRLVACGMTRADLCGLRWADVDLDAGTVSVAQGRVQLGNDSVIDEPKSKARRRTLPVDAVWGGTTTHLRALRARQAAIGTALVLTDRKGRPVRPQVVSERFQRLTEQVGLPRIRLHATRHSLAALMDELDLPLAWRAAFSGHTVAVHVANYLPRGGDEEIQRVADALGTRLGAVAL